MHQPSFLAHHHFQKIHHCHVPVLTAGRLISSGGLRQQALHQLQGPCTPDDRAHAVVYGVMMTCSYTVDGETYSQSNAIVRHLGRKHSLYGASEHDSLRVDAILDGIDDIRRKYFMVVYSGMMQPGGLDAYWQKTCDPATIGGFNGGAHFEFLNRIFKKSQGNSSGFAVGEAAHNCR